jgi:hypothetical protein
MAVLSTKTTQNAEYDNALLADTARAVARALTR